MAAIVVAILDRDDWGANTDILVQVDAARRRLTWIPRDLWSPLAGDRINGAFALGGEKLLARSLEALGFRCDGVLCLRRGATEAAAAELRVTVPINNRLDFWYPLHPTRPIEEGRKQVTFLPPEESLEGERLHQWIGARYEVNASGSDLRRLARQQVLLKAMLGQGTDFAAVLRDPELVRHWGRDPMPVLAGVTADWSMTTYRDVRSETIDGKMVLVPKTPREPIPPRWRRALGRIIRLVTPSGRGPTKGPRPPTSATPSSRPE